EGVPEHVRGDVLVDPGRAAHALDHAVVRLWADRKELSAWVACLDVPVQGRVELRRGEQVAFLASLAGLRIEDVDGWRRIGGAVDMIALERDQLRAGETVAHHQPDSSLAPRFVAG